MLTPSKKFALLLVLLVAATALFAWKTSTPQSSEAILEAKIEALYRADTHGGKTPEETLALFIAALEKKNPVLASKYFELESQEEMEEKMAAGLSNGAAEIFITLTSTSFSREVVDMNTVHFLFDGMLPPFALSFYRNPYSYIWKLGKF